jgi:hypothetical protein
MDASTLSNMEELGLWVSALLTLAIYSFLYKDNPLYKLAEHIFVGVSTGYLLVVALTDALWRDLIQPLSWDMEANFFILLPGLFGFLMFTRLFEKMSWMSRISLAIFIGVTSGYAIPTYIQGDLIKQTEATLIPLYSATGPGGWGGFMISLNAIIVLLGVLSVLIYFFFSVKHEGLTGYASRLGTAYLMIYFGAAFGYTVMGRVSLLIGRMRFLILDWIGAYIGLGS